MNGVELGYESVTELNFRDAAGYGFLCHFEISESSNMIAQPELSTGI
jgi:hypothetical protein